MRITEWLENHVYWAALLFGVLGGSVGTLFTVSIVHFYGNYLTKRPSQATTFAMVNAASARLKLSSTDPWVRFPNLIRKGERSVERLEDCLVESGGDFKKLKSFRDFQVVKYVSTIGHVGTMCKSGEVVVLRKYDYFWIIARAAFRLKKQAVEQLLDQERDGPKIDVGPWRFVDVVDDYNFRGEPYIAEHTSCAVGIPDNSTDSATNGTMKEVGLLGGKKVHRYTSPKNFYMYMVCPDGVLFIEQ